MQRAIVAVSVSLYRRLVCGVSASRADWPVIRLQRNSSCIHSSIDGDAADAAAAADAQADDCTATLRHLYISILSDYIRRLTGHHGLVEWCCDEKRKSSLLIVTLRIRAVSRKI